MGAKSGKLPYFSKARFSARVWIQETKLLNYDHTLRKTTPFCQPH